MTLLEERLLVTEAQRGDQKALGVLWDAITPKLYGYLMNTLRDKSLAEDILQNTWQKAIQSLSAYEHRDTHFSAWLFAIAKNECRQYWRKPRREDPLESIEQTLTGNSLSAQSETHLMIEHVLGRLSEDDRELLRLRYIADLSFKEVAKILHITPISARVRVHRALSRARELLTSESL